MRNKRKRSASASTPSSGCSTSMASASSTVPSTPASLQKTPLAGPARVSSAAQPRSENVASTCAGAAAPELATRATEWRPVICDLGDFPGYWINAKGEVLSSRRSNKPRLLRATTVKDGHLRLRLTDAGGKTHNIFAHRLVAFTYHGFPPPEKPYACHIDGNPANNCPANIYWGSPQENADDRKRHGTSARGMRHGSSKLTEAQVREVRRLAASTARSQAYIGRQFGVSHSVIGCILKGKTWGWLDHAS